jgi:hypothetical protein
MKPNAEWVHADCIVNNLIYEHYLPVTVAVRSEAWVLAGWLLWSWVRIPLKAWMFVRVFLCFVVLCRYRHCDGLITRPRSPTICLNSSRNLPYVRRPRSFKDSRATGGGGGEMSITWGQNIFFTGRFNVPDYTASQSSNPRPQHLPRQENAKSQSYILFSSRDLSRNCSLVRPFVYIQLG